MGWHIPRIEYFFLTFPITLSTCIRTFAIRRVCSNSIQLSCFFPLVYAGKVSYQTHDPLKLSWQKFVQKSTIFSQVFVTHSSSPSIRYKANNSMWCYTNQIFSSIMMYDEYVCTLARRAEG